MSSSNGKSPPLRITPAVRIAGPADEPEVCRLLLLAHAENAIQEASNDKVLWHIRRFLNGPWLPAESPGPRGVFGVIGPVGKLEAICMLAIACTWYSEKLHLEEYLVFVDPEHRKGHTRHGIALIDWMRDQSAKTRLKVISGILSNHRTEAKCRLYRRYLPKIGEYFLYDPEDGKPRFYSDTLTGPGSMLVAGSSMAA